MINVQPTGLNSTALTANEQSLLLTITESIAPRVCLSGAPTFTLNYSTGNVVLDDTTLFVPVNITVIALWPTKGNNSVTKVYKESFVAAFQGNDSTDVTVTVASAGSATQSELTSYSNENSYSVYESITITIASA